MEKEDPFQESDRGEELAEKRQRLQEFLSAQGLDALLVSRLENIAWATAGLVDVRVGVPRETGATSLLFTRDGAYYLTTNNEAPRLAKEEFALLDYEPLVDLWYAANSADLVRRVVGSGKVGADHPGAAFPHTSISALRQKLTKLELVRYRQLGENVATVVTEAIAEVKPGMSERKMQALVASGLLERGILPSVLLTATDDRIRNYRHAVPRGARLKHFGMLNLCARRWGLCVSMTRFVHFGPMPTELAEKFSAVARVNAKLHNATREGSTAEDLFFVAQEAYAAEGYTGEEKMHHQGGATGYWEREWIARPGGAECVQAIQSMAWNPSIQGAKIEDTVLLWDGKLETITRTPALPSIGIPIGKAMYNFADVLLA